MQNRSFLGSIPPVTLNLIIVNFIVWLAALTLPKIAGINLNYWLGLHYFAADDFNVVQLITYMFLHDTSGIEHIFFNMFSVFMFGRTLEAVWGGKRFLFYYITTGMGAALVQEAAWYFELRSAISETVALYGWEKDWETVKQFAFEAALVNTDAVVQPRQSNTWGALSLDHVYEFMGGMNLAVRHVTGKDPDAYLSDYRNRNNVRMQEVKEAIGVESRTTIFNPAYIREKMKGEAGAAATFAEIVQNTYGWNVMKPKAVDKELWDEIYNIYVKDKFGLGLQAYFEKQNPAALEEITAVMMETARKGMWKASEQQLADIAQLHTQLIAKYKPSCSGFVCDNAKLRDFIASKTDAASAVSYRKDITAIREQMVEGTDKGMVMKKEQVNTQTDETTNVLSNTVVVCVVLVLVVALILLVRRRHKHLND